MDKVLVYKTKDFGVRSLVESVHDLISENKNLGKEECGTIFFFLYLFIFLVVTASLRRLIGKPTPQAM